jgi:hypothetical protein
MSGFAIIVVAQDHRLLVFFRRHDGHALATTEIAHQDVVGDHIQLLLGFALHVLGAGAAQHIFQPRPAHLRRNHLGGDGDRRQHPGQRTGGFRVARLRLQDVRLDGDQGAFARA